MKTTKTYLQFRNIPMVVLSLLIGFTITNTIARLSLLIMDENMFYGLDEFGFCLWIIFSSAIGYLLYNVKIPVKKGFLKEDK